MLAIAPNKKFYSCRSHQHIQHDCYSKSSVALVNLPNLQREKSYFTAITWLTIPLPAFLFYDNILTMLSAPSQPQFKK